MNLRTPGKRTEQAKNRVLFLSSSRVFFPVDSFFFNLVQKYELAGLVFFGFYVIISTGNVMSVANTRDGRPFFISRSYRI